MNEKLLLGVDSLINVVLGVLLLIFPIRVVDALGAPIPENNFYANILSAVLLGIGLALLLEYFREKTGVAGLGIGGAIIINLCAAGVLALWLSFGSLEIPVCGHVTLWSLTILVLGVSLFETALLWKRKGVHQ